MITTNATIRLREKARELNVLVEPDSTGRFYEIRVTAPLGYVFVGDGLHQLVCAQTYARESRATIARLALNRMQEGIAPCEDRNCDVCVPDT